MQSVSADSLIQTEKKQLLVNLPQPSGSDHLCKRMSLRIERDLDDGTDSRRLDTEPDWVRAYLPGNLYPSDMPAIDPDTNEPLPISQTDLLKPFYCDDIGLMQLHLQEAGSCCPKSLRYCGAS
jgi:hypothetical protein